jgi:putative transcriptional regulator
MQYSEAIKKLRKKLILSQTEFGDLIGVSFQSINRWERGKHEPTIKLKRKLAILFNQHEIKMK